MGARRSLPPVRIWRAVGHGDWTIAVNLSPQQFMDAALAQTVRDALRRHELEPVCLILEITESTAMRDVELSLAVLRQLRETGVQIASTTSAPVTRACSI